MCTCRGFRLQTSLSPLVQVLKFIPMAAYRNTDHTSENSCNITILMHKRHYEYYSADELIVVTKGRKLTCMLCLWGRRLCVLFLILDALQELLDLTVVSGPLGHDPYGGTQLRLFGLWIITLWRHATKSCFISHYTKTSTETAYGAFFNILAAVLPRVLTMCL